MVPTNVSNNVTFLLDVSKFKSWADWKCDDMGAWRNNGTKKHSFSHKNGLVKATDSEDIVEDGTVYTLVRMYYKNKTSPDLKKCVSFIEGKCLNKQLAI